MSPKLGDLAPDFNANSTIGNIWFHEIINDSWVFFFSHPQNYTPVCTTEMGRTAQLKNEFTKRNTIPIGLSTDSVDSHKGWINDINDIHNTAVDYPIIADTTFSISRLYGMIHHQESSTQAARSVFIIDPLKRIRLTMTYPMNIGRNFEEILRVIDALQLADKHQIATPADWRPGDEVIIPPSIHNKEASTLFPQGWDAIRPYYRVTML